MEILLFPDFQNLEKEVRSLEEYVAENIWEYGTTDDSPRFNMQGDAKKIAVDRPVHGRVMRKVFVGHHYPLHGGVGPVQVSSLPIEGDRLDTAPHSVKVLAGLVGQQIQCANQSVSKIKL